MNVSNKSHLIAGFFRYHREKLNYSLRGLVGDGKIVELSSLSDFENGKRTLSEAQLVKLFQLIEFDYRKILNSYDFSNEYRQIIEYIFLGEIENAEKCYYTCINQGVFNTLGVLNFSLLNYVLSSIDSVDNERDECCMSCFNLLDSNQMAVLIVSKVNEKISSGNFNDAVDMLREAEKLTYNAKIRAWICHKFGIVYGLIGNYAEATVALLDAKNRYGEFIGVIRMIQTNLNLGNVYTLTNSYAKAEESYLIAYERAKMLKESTRLLTKCFNSLCWLYFEMNEYDKVQELLSNKPDELVESRNTYYILAWACYQLGKKEAAVKYCIAGRTKFAEYSYVCMIYEYIEKACQGKKTGQEALLKKIIETEDYDHDALTERLFTLELMKLYESRENYEKAYKTAKKLLNR